MIEKPKYFDDCFQVGIRNCREFNKYVDIVFRHSASSPSQNFPEKHHIVPREWLSWRVNGFNFDTEDENNVVYLSVRSKLMSMQYLTLVFLEMGDSTTYRNLTKTVSRRYHIGWYDFWKSPYLDKNLVEFLVEKRNGELSTKKRKYDDEYLLKCKEILESSKDKDEAFEKIKNEMGFEFTRRALDEQIKRRFGKIV